MASRLTYRDKTYSIAWQKLTRDRFNFEGSPQVDLSVKSALVRRVSYKFAKRIILKYEWLGNMSSTSYHYGIFFGSHCAGVVCFGSNCTGGINVHKWAGVEHGELMILARGACVHWAPNGANSKLVSWATKLLRRDYGKCKIILAYSDTDAGEFGTIYQACNWLFVGPGQATNQWVGPNGRIWDEKLASNRTKKYGASRQEYIKRLRESGFYQQKSNPKYRYVCLIDKKDKALLSRFLDMSKPYPKRPLSIDSDVSVVQTEEGGASPTRGL